MPCAPSFFSYLPLSLLLHMRATCARLKLGTTLLLLLSLLVFSGGWQFSAAAEKKPALRPVQDFLPPVASINEQLPSAESPDTPETISLSAVHAPALHVRPKALPKGAEALSIAKTLHADAASSLQTLQQSLETDDLKTLWQSAIDRSPVIRFSLEKLAMPRDLHQKHASRFLNKTLNILISGATMASVMVPGGDAYRNMGVMASGDALRNVINGNTQPGAGNTLSPTELIQLADLVDDMRLKLIRSYQGYKQALSQLSEARAEVASHHGAYAQALASGEELSLLATGTAYYRARLTEAALWQDAKRCRLVLERLSGPDAVGSLKLAMDPAWKQSPVANATSPGATSLASHLEASALPSLAEDVKSNGPAALEMTGVQALSGPIPLPPAPPAPAGNTPVRDLIP